MTQTVQENDTGERGYACLIRVMGAYHPDQ